MSKETLKANLREIPDFPIPGILFYDVTTLFKNPECLQEILDTLYEMYKDKGITKVVGIESRGFIMGGALAARLGAGFVMARKPGKLPAEVVEETYAKEYGTDTIQIHKDAIDENDVVLLTMIYWLPAEPWRPLIAWYKDVAPKRFSSISLSNWEV